MIHKIASLMLVLAFAFCAFLAYESVNYNETFYMSQENINHATDAFFVYYDRAMRLATLASSILCFISLIYAIFCTNVTD
jgi:hypothetical protein